MDIGIRGPKYGALVRKQQAVPVEPVSPRDYEHDEGADHGDVDLQLAGKRQAFAFEVEPHEIESEGAEENQDGGAQEPPLQKVQHRQGEHVERDIPIEDRL